MKKDLLDISLLSKKDIRDFLVLTKKIKSKPSQFTKKLAGKSLLMMFEKPSLRTRVSFEVGMTQLGGHAIYYHLSNSPMGKKESVSDTAKTSSRYVDLIMARLNKHSDILELAKNADVPVINAMTDYSHPCQVISDLFTIKEKKRNFKSLKLAYFGDANNNVTNSLLFACAIMGIDISVACPKQFSPSKKVIKIAKDLSNKKIAITTDAKQAAKNADIIYTDSWMSYHVPEKEMEKRINIFKPFQVTKKLMSLAKKGAVFMNCLPAMRGMEQTADVIDGSQSIVFDQAENRLHTQKAIMLKLLKAKV